MCIKKAHHFASRIRSPGIGKAAIRTAAGPSMSEAVHQPMLGYGIARAIMLYGAGVGVTARNSPLRPDLTRLGCRGTSAARHYLIAIAHIDGMVCIAMKDNDRDPIESWQAGA